jgi:hypothetical protein
VTLITKSAKAIERLGRRAAIGAREISAFNGLRAFMAKAAAG